MSRNANKLSQLAEDILDVFRIESKIVLSLHKEQFNINNIIEDVSSGLSKSNFKISTTVT